jgi:hypothetical protein
MLEKLKSILDSSDFKIINENKMNITGIIDEHVLHHHTHILP